MSAYSPLLVQSSFMSIRVNLKGTFATLLSLSLCTAMVSALVAPPQGLGSGFQGQDIMGGAAIVFKRPQRVRDLLGGASSMVVVKRSPKPRPPAEEARNTPPDRRRPPRPRPVKLLLQPNRN